MRLLIGAALVTLLISGCSNLQKVVDYRPAINGAMQAMKLEITYGGYFAYDVQPAMHIFFHAVPAETNVDWPVSLQHYANRLRTIDVTQCPEDFRLAWINLVHILENYQGLAGAGHSASAGTAGVVVIRTASKEAGELAARQFQEIMALGEIKQALQNLETVCLKYGVQPTIQKPGDAKE
jgi:hypothetical protein